MKWNQKTSMAKKNLDFKIDQSDEDALRSFFKEHYDYTTFELCRKYGISVSTLNRWKRKIGIPSSKNKAFKINPRKPQKIKPIKDQKIWDNGPWFVDMYVNKQIGAYIIAKMINRSVVVVYNRLRRFNIQLRDHESSIKTKNKFYDKQWLWENYMRLSRSAEDVAKEAGVHSSTIKIWLSKLGIPVRDNSAASVIRERNKRIKKYCEKNGTSFKKIENQT